MPERGPAGTRRHRERSPSSSLLDRPPALMPTCALCHADAELRDSHVLPAFVFRWLRERSATGHIRNTDNINRRVQDGLKKPWLCERCEQLFSRDEQAFASRLFHPWLAGASRIEYHAWLLRFCASVSWRVLRHAKGLNPDHHYTPEEDRAADDAERTWRDFLLGRSNGVGRFEQHLLPMDIIESTTVDDLPDNINRYLAGYVDMDVVGSSKTMMTYAKLGRFIIFGMVRKGREEWKGSRVNAQHGHLQARRYVLPHGLIGFFRDRASICREAIDGMSPAQIAKVDSAVMANMDRMRGSDQLRAMLADAAMFGEQAVVRRR